MNLPEEYIKNMTELLGEEVSEYLNSFQQKRYYGIRVNTTKISTKEFERISPFTLKKIPWTSNGYYISEEENPAKHPYYYAGLYYIQEPSAMTPAQYLPITPGDRVLDLCAAPGGKATELGAKLQGKGLLVANDISASRALALLKNLELAGIPNIMVTAETPERLSKAYPEYFQKILVDAPCSGEGMFRKDSKLIKSWEEHGPKFYAPIQLEILHQAYQMLSEDGLILYSTCTFSPLEDESVIASFLNDHPDMETIPFCNPYQDFEQGREPVTNALRLFPHRIKGEGHFLALLHKKGTAKSAPNSSVDSKWKEYRNKEQVYHIPPDCSVAKGIRYLRTGLYIGDEKHGKLQYSQAYAMSLQAESFENTLMLSLSDERVLRYLKCETLFITEDEHLSNGDCLVCVDGFPLGFGKINGCQLKNKYLPGWRWNS